MWYSAVVILALALAPPQGTRSGSFEVLNRVQSDFPAYRFPKRADIVGLWMHQWEEYGADASCVAGDFTGNKGHDYATIALAVKGPGHALVVLLGGSGGTYKQYLLAEDSGSQLLPQEAILSIGMPIQPPLTEWISAQSLSGTRS